MNKEKILKFYQKANSNCKLVDICNGNSLCNEDSCKLSIGDDCKIHSLGYACIKENETELTICNGITCEKFREDIEDYG